MLRCFRGTRIDEQGGLSLECLVAAAVLAGLFAVGWVLQKMGGVALVGVNRGIFFRGEYKEGKKLREGLTFRTSASVPEVMRELDTYVCAVDAPLGFSNVVYTAARSDRGIAWAYGNVSGVKLEAVIVTSADDSGIEAAFMVTRWSEEDGLVEAVDALKALRMQVIAAFKAADPAVYITEGFDEQRALTQFAGAFETAE
jgi:hypothetical protein